MNPKATRVGWNVTGSTDDDISISHFNGKGDITVHLTMSRPQFTLLMNSNSKLYEQVRLLDRPNKEWPWSKLAAYIRINDNNPWLIYAVAEKAGINSSSAIDLIATWKV